MLEICDYNSSLMTPQHLSGMQVTPIRDCTRNQGHWKLDQSNTDNYGTGKNEVWLFRCVNHLYLFVALPHL